jgi:hypothetical protein
MEGFYGIRKVLTTNRSYTMKKVILFILLIAAIGYSQEWKAQKLEGMAYMDDGERYASIIEGPGLAFTMYVPEFKSGIFGFVKMYVDGNYIGICTIEETTHKVTQVFLSRSDIKYLKKGYNVMFYDEGSGTKFSFSLTGFIKAWNQTF